MTADDAALSATSVAPSASVAAKTQPSSDHPVDSIEDKAANSTQTSRPAPNGAAADHDSEAETDIEPGRVVGPLSASRKIKHEANNPSTNGHDKSSGVLNRTQHSDEDHADPSEKPSGENSNSSILTSVVSSPSHLDDDSSRAASADSPHSPSKTSVDSDNLARNAKRKRDDEANGTEHKRRIKQEQSPARDALVKKRRSNSPNVRQRRRTLSTQSATLDQGNRSGRRKPAPIRTAPDHDADEDSDDSSASHHRHRKPPTSAHQHNASVNRKMPPTINTSKYRDRNGRTLLAKACYTDSVSVVRERLEENPGHLDEPEYADNTPLQIAALRGHAEIVKFLIDSGANVHTQNNIKDTPLIDAVENSNFEVVRLLLDAGVNPSQPNAKGEEPLELIPEDEDDEEATEAGKRIESALRKAKEKWKTRRPSEANDQQTTSSRRSTAAQSPRGSPSYTTLARHVSDTGNSRRAPRGSSKRNDLLYITPTPQALRKAAGMGDAEATNHLLSMGQTADSHAVLAAAKGCHQSCLDLLLAMGKPEPDPDPISGLKAGWDTPLLAAIGQSGDNISIIEALLGQAGFNPTRKVFQGKTYHEIAKERAGSNSQAEYEILKRAFDNHVRKHGSPKSGKAATIPKRRKQTGSDSPKIARTSQPEQRKDLDHKAKRPADATPRRKESVDRPSSSGSHLQVPQKLKSRESSVAISDRADSPARREKKRRISSSSDDDKKALPKQRKRLLTAKERREGEERKRRSSITSIDSASSTLKRSNGDVKKNSNRSAVSPTRQKKLPSDRKTSDSTVPVKRNPVPESQSGESKAATQDSSGALQGSASHKDKLGKKHSSRPNTDLHSPASTAPTATSASADMDADRAKRKRDETEASHLEQERKQRESEMAERDRKAEAERLEAERLRQEKQAAERAKKEEAERVLKEKQEKEQREAQERQEVEARKLKQRKADCERLPDGFFHALYDHESPPSTHDLKLWCVLFAITTENLSKRCRDAKDSSADKDAYWIMNFQVAILLGLKDWSLQESGFELWPRVSMPGYLASAPWGWFNSALVPRKSLADESEPEYWARLTSQQKKFETLALEEQIPFFWVRLEDFAKIRAQYQHTLSILNPEGNLRIQPCTFHPSIKGPAEARVVEKASEAKEN